MTEKEFYQIRNSYSGRNNKRTKEEQSSGYFSYFKIRCLLCLIFFLTLLVLDRQLGLEQYDQVNLCMQMLGDENLSVEECFNLVDSQFLQREEDH